MVRTQGFTLLELLVVSSIISVIASMFIANYSNLRIKVYDSQAVACANSLNRAVGIYKIDHPAFSSIPGVASFYGTATARDLYGTGVCKNMILNGESLISGFKFTVQHPQGQKVFIVSESDLYAE